MLGRLLAYVGMYSYSIYLWHLSVREWELTLIHKILRVSIGPWASFILYAVTAVGIGIFFSRVLEYPVLRLRDRLFPAAPGQLAINPPMNKEIPIAVAPTTGATS